MESKIGRQLTNVLLSDNGVSYYENIESPGALDIPAHVRGLKEELLDFKKVLLRQDVEDVLGQKELGKIPKSAESDPLPRHLWMRKDRIRDPNIEWSIELMSKAGEHVINMPPEWAWTKLARDFVFKKAERPPGRNWIDMDIVDQIAM